MRKNNFGIKLPFFYLSLSLFPVRTSYKNLIPILKILSSNDKIIAFRKQFLSPLFQLFTSQLLSHLVFKFFPPNLLQFKIIYCMNHLI